MGKVVELIQKEGRIAISRVTNLGSNIIDMSDHME